MTAAATFGAMLGHNDQRNTLKNPFRRWPDYRTWLSTFFGCNALCQFSNKSNLWSEIIPACIRYADWNQVGYCNIRIWWTRLIAFLRNGENPYLRSFVRLNRKLWYLITLLSIFEVQWISYLRGFMQIMALRKYLICFLGRFPGSLSIQRSNIVKVAVNSGGVSLVHTLIKTVKNNTKFNKLLRKLSRDGHLNW